MVSRQPSLLMFQDAIRLDVRHSASYLAPLRMTFCVETCVDRSMTVSHGCSVNSARLATTCQEKSHPPSDGPPLSTYLSQPATSITMRPSCVRLQARCGSVLSYM